MKQLADILKGRNVKSNILHDGIMDKHKGRLRYEKDEDIRRIVLSMLQAKLLKETFNPGMHNQIIVYICPSKYSSKLMENS